MPGAASHADVFLRSLSEISHIATLIQMAHSWYYPHSTPLKGCAVIGQWLIEGSDSHFCILLVQIQG